MINVASNLFEELDRFPNALPPRIDVSDIEYSRGNLKEGKSNYPCYPPSDGDLSDFKIRQGTICPRVTAAFFDGHGGSLPVVASTSSSACK